MDNKNKNGFGSVVFFLGVLTGIVLYFTVIR